MDQMLDIQIVRAITAIGPLTRAQIINRVSGNSTDVEASLDALVTMGCLRTELNTFKQFEYRLKPNFSERDCKYSVHREKVAAFVAKHGSESKAVLPVDNGIKFAEGLDRAIWKATNTGRWMMVREIRDILTAVGFQKRDVIRRIQHFIDEGVWFARQSGHRHNQFFRLRDNVECPPLPGERLRGDCSIIAFLDDAGLFKQQPESAIQPAVTTPQVAASSSLITQKENEVMPDGYFPLSAMGEKVLSEAVKHLLTLVREDGTLHEAIWAILSDNEEYSCADLVLVLSKVGFTEKQISPLLSKRYADGLLSRRLVQVKGKWVNVYKKVGELPAKFTSTGSVVSDIIDAQATTEVKVIASQVASETAQIVEKPELFSYAIHIKGVEIGMNEFQALYKELYEEGFVREVNRAEAGKPKLRVIKTTHEIKGVQFSREELIDLTNAMYQTANEFKRALAV